MAVIRRLAWGLLLLAVHAVAWGHGVAEGDKGYVEQAAGVHLIAFTYLGAKRMVIGYDHCCSSSG